MRPTRTPSTPDARIARLAAAQHGVVALDQLRALGVGVGAVNTRVRAGRLHRLHRGVFAVGHSRLSREGRWLAAVLALGDGAVLSHASAGALWDLRPSSAAAIHVTVPTPGGRRSRRGIVVHRSGALHPRDVARRHGIPVTSVARTLLDLATTLADGPLTRAVERALVLRLFDLARLTEAIDRNPARRGAGRLARVVASLRDEPALTRSELEGQMLDLCAASGLVSPEINALLAGCEVDFLWRNERLVVETDGHEHHGTRSAFERDRARDARLTALGYRVVRVTYRQLVRERDVVACRLEALLAGGSGPSSGGG